MSQAFLNRKVSATCPAAADDRVAEDDGYSTKPSAADADPGSGAHRVDDHVCTCALLKEALMRNPTCL